MYDEEGYFGGVDSEMGKGVWGEELGVFGLAGRYMCDDS